MTSPSGLVRLEIKLRHVLEESPSGKPTSIWKFPCVSLGKLARNDGVSIYVVFSIHGDTPRNGWFRMENPIKMDDLEVPPFQEICISIMVYRMLLQRSAKAGIVQDQPVQNSLNFALGN